MNPMTNMKNVKKLSEQELQKNYKTSWHDQYKDSAWIFVGGLPYNLTEGDIICVFSQYGEIVNINLVRDKDTGKQKGFCFICYQDQRSTVLAVDNLNGIKILGRSIRVDHVNNYKMPKDHKNTDAETRKLQNEGCAPETTPTKQEKKPEMPIPSTELPAFAKEEEAPPDGFRLPPRLPIRPLPPEDDPVAKKVKGKKEKKHKREKRKKKSKKKHRRNSDESSTSDTEKSSSDDSESSLNDSRTPEERGDPKPSKKNPRDERGRSHREEKTSKRDFEVPGQEAEEKKPLRKYDRDFYKYGRDFYVPKRYLSERDREQKNRPFDRREKDDSKRFRR